MPPKSKEDRAKEAAELVARIEALRPEDRRVIYGLINNAVMLAEAGFDEKTVVKYLRGAHDTLFPKA